jgi:hypothetical protein
MRYAFWTVDVFTDREFGGNPLAVIPYANGLTDEQMQLIAREFSPKPHSSYHPSRPSIRFGFASSRPLGSFRLRDTRPSGVRSSSACAVASS